MNVDSQSEKEQLAKEKFESGTKAFTCRSFSAAVNHYREAGEIYNELEMKRDALTAYYQAIMARRWQFPGFLEKEKQDFLRPEYLEELEEFASNFSEFEQEVNQLYKEKYLKTKYTYLLSKGYKSQQENEYESESKALLELATFVETHPDIFPDYQVEYVFRWRMMAEQAKVRLLRSKGASLGFLAEEYKRIANMNEPPEGSTSPFVEKVKAHQANFYAASFKFSAFSKLEKRRPTISDVKAAMESMKQALSQAEKAKEWFDRVDEKKGLAYVENIRYLSYWCNIFWLRASVVDMDFEKAQAALEAALSDARYYKDSKRENDIFPNYYADFDDLKNETLIISASKALFIERDVRESGGFLKEWIDRTKKRHLGSWRFNNIYIRYLVVSLLELLPSLKDHLQDCNDKLKDLEGILKNEFVGSASRKLALIAKDIVKFVDVSIIEINDDLYNALFHKICDFFPIESKTSDFGIIEAHRELLDPFQFLPEYFSKCFKKPENLNKFDPSQTQKMYHDLMEGLRYYFLVITEFHYKRYLAFKQQELPMLGTLPDHFECTFDKMNVGKLIIALGEICKALHRDGRRFQKFQIAFSDVKGLPQPNTQTIATIEILEKSFQVVSEKIIPKTYMKFFPHLVQVKLSYEIEGTKVYKVRRIWKKGIPEDLNIFGPELTLENGAYYYLTPRWKRCSSASIDTRSAQFAIFKSDLYPITVTNYLSSLKQKLSDCPAGSEGWRDYEEICIQILKSLFVPPLDLPVIQSRTEDGLLRRDALCPNCVERGFWATMGNWHDAKLILFEFKNTKALEPTHVDQVDKYLRLCHDTIGRFGIIISRNPPTPTALSTRRAWFTSDKTVILFLDDCLLVKALELREAGKDPVSVLKAEYYKFLTNYEP